VPTQKLPSQLPGGAAHPGQGHWASSKNRTTFPLGRILTMRKSVVEGVRTGQQALPLLRWQGADALAAVMETPETWGTLFIST